MIPARQPRPGWETLRVGRTKPEATGLAALRGGRKQRRRREWNHPRGAREAGARAQGRGEAGVRVTCPEHSGEGGDPRSSWGSPGAAGRRAGRAARTPRLPARRGGGALTGGGLRPGVSGLGRQSKGTSRSCPWAPPTLLFVSPVRPEPASARRRAGGRPGIGQRLFPAPLSQSARGSVFIPGSK